MMSTKISKKQTDAKPTKRAREDDGRTEPSISVNNSHLTTTRDGNTINMFIVANCIWHQNAVGSARLPSFRF